MPNVRFVLKESGDGKHLIMGSFTFNHQQLKFSTQQKIEKKFWNAEKQKASSTWEFDGDELNTTLRKIKDWFFDEYRRQINDGSIPTKDSIRKAYEIYMNRRPPDNKDLISYIDQFLDRYKDFYDLKTKQKYQLLQKNLKEFQSKVKYRVNFDTISKDFYFKFWGYCANELEYHDNTFGDMIKKLKKVLSEAVEDGISSCIEHTKKYFKAPDIPPDTIFLTRDEVTTLYGTDMGSERRNFKRDLFVLACQLGLRQQDWHTLKNHLQRPKERLIRIKARKNLSECVIPVNSLAREIFDRYKDYQWEMLSGQKMNDFIKDLCKKAGFTQTLNITYKKGNQTVVKEFFKYDLITCHTARRTFATNCLIDGLTANEVMKMTGHKSYSSFQRYIRDTSLMNAQKLLSHPSFTK